MDEHDSEHSDLLWRPIIGQDKNIVPEKFWNANNCLRNIVRIPCVIRLHNKSNVERFWLLLSICAEPQSSCATMLWMILHLSF